MNLFLVILNPLPVSDIFVMLWFFFPHIVWKNGLSLICIWKLLFLLFSWVTNILIFFFECLQVRNVWGEQFRAVLYQLCQWETSAAVQLCKPPFIPGPEPFDLCYILCISNKQINKSGCCFFSVVSMCLSWSRRSTWRSKSPGLW